MNPRPAASAPGLRQRLCVSLLAVLCAGAARPVLAQAVTTVVACGGDPAILLAPPGQATYAWNPETDLVGQGGPVAAVTPPAERVYTVRSRAASGPNLVVNGDFELGNRDFTTTYRYVPGGTFDRGTYAILQRPRDFNVAFAACVDPSRGASGRMFVADGSERSGQRVWCQRVAGLDPAGTYAFSAQVTALVTPNPARLAFAIDGQRVGPELQAGRPCEWLGFYAVWDAAGATDCELCITNLNATLEGNDFALDDIAFAQLGPERVDSFRVRLAPKRDTSVTVALCPGQAYTAGGLALGPDSSGVATLRTAAGCDSVVRVTTVRRDSTVTTSRADTLCPGETLAWQGLTLTRDTTACIRYVGANGCDSLSCLTVEFLDAAALEVTATPPSCPGLADGALAVTVTAGRPPFTYRWDDGSSAPTRSGLAGGSYTLAVTDVRGCRAERTYTLAEPPGLALVDAFPVPARCFGEANGLILALATGGTGPVAYYAERGGRRYPLDSLTAGTYRVVAEDSLGCRTDSLVAVTQPAEVRAGLRGDTLVRLGLPARHEVTAAGEGARVRLGFEGQSLDSLVGADGVLRWFPSEDGTLRLTVTDSFACEAQATWRLRVERPEERPLFPNAFSPNGDGVNDRFGPVLDPAVEAVASLLVYDRWGGELYRVASCPRASFQACAWDGTSGGRDLGTGVYVFAAVLRLVDGTLVKEAGEVVLVR